MSQDCGCGITSETYDEGKRYRMKIVYCPLHASAAQMREALKKARRMVQGTNIMGDEIHPKLLAQIDAALRASKGEEVKP